MNQASTFAAPQQSPKQRESLSLVFVSVGSVGSEGLLDLFKQVCCDNGLMLGVVCNFLVDDLADVFFVNQDVIHISLSPSLATEILAGFGSVLFHPEPFGVQCLGHFSTRLKFQRHFENPPDEPRFLLVDHIPAVNDVESQLGLASDVFALSGRTQLIRARANRCLMNTTC